MEWTDLRGSEHGTLETVNEIRESQTWSIGTNLETHADAI